MRSLKLNLILWLSIVLIFEVSAQSPYTFVLKGAPSPYDSGVVVEIHQYRKETLKLKLGSTLVDSLFAEIRSWRQERLLSDSVIRDQAFTISLQAKTIERKDTTIAAMNKNFIKLGEEAIDLNKRKWFERPVVTIPGGVIFGMVIQGLLSRK